MSTEQSSRQSYSTPAEYYPAYRDSSVYSEVGGEISSVSGTPQQHYHAPQPGWQSTHKLQPGQREKITPLQCMILAIVSVGMIALFSMIILTSTQNTSTGLIGVGIMCGAIFLVNVVFNRREA